MTILHQNIRGLSNKIDRLNHLLNETSPNIVILTEHGLQHNEITNTKIQGYNLISEYSRTEHKLGGTAIYCMEKLTNNIEAIDIKHFCEELLFEAAMVHIKVKGKNIHILGVYRPPGGNTRNGLDILSNILNYGQAHNKFFLLLGDINIDSLKINNPDNLMLENELTIQNMRRLPLPATRITAETRSSIDCICTNIPEPEVTAVILQAGLSDHTAQLCSLDLSLGTSSTFNIKRQIGRTNLENLKSILFNKNWCSIEGAENAETAYNKFYDTLHIALDISCPQRKTRNRGPKKPAHFYDAESIEMKASYIRALNTYEITGSIRDKEIMANRKRTYDQKLRALRRRSNSQYIEDSDNKTKALWSLINNERRGKQNNQACPKLNFNNTIIHNPLEVAETFNTYFTQIADMTIQQQINNTQSLDRTEEEHNPPNVPLSQSFRMTPTSWTEVNKIIHSLKNKPSSGIDEFSSQTVKYCANELTQPLTLIINKSFAEGHFPSRLKVSKVYAKHKKGPKSDPQNYRPISLISTFAKIIEKLVLKRLMAYLIQHNLITANQHGFQKGKSTISAIISLIESVIDAIEEEKYVTGLFLDYSKAFDCLGHGLILEKLKSLGIRGTENKWFASYLQGRTQVVEVQHTEYGITRSHTSDPKPLTRGVPQGSVLGPVLFILLTNDFPAYIDSPSTDCIMYADDTTLLIKSDTAADISFKSLTSLKRAIKYSTLNDLAINPNKTTQVHFSTRKDIPANIPDISVVNKTQFLGLTLDSTLSWSDHVNTISNKICAGIYVMRRLNTVGTLASAKSAYYALVESQIRYGLIIWGSSTGNLKRVLTLQKRAIRSLANLEPQQSCREAFKNLGILTVPALYIYEAILHADRLNLETLNNVHSHNTRHASRYVLPQHRTALFEKKPSYAGRKLKNILPEDLQTLTGNALKKSLHEYLLKKPPYSIDEFLGTANT